MKQALSKAVDVYISSPKTARFTHEVHSHINHLSRQYTRSCTPSRSFSIQATLQASNRVQPSIRRPPDFHTLLQSSGTTNNLLLTLFKTSTCTSCGTIAPLIESIVKNRPVPSAGDKFGSIAFAELELDSPDQDPEGGRGWNSMYDIGIEYGVTSVPALIGFGGRRGERITERVTNVNNLKDKEWLQNWIDEVMRKGDPYPSEGKGLFSKLFGGGT